MKQICSDNKISLNAMTRSKIALIRKNILQYLNVKVSEGFESPDRRFLLLPNGQIHYQGEKKEVIFSLGKLLASLCLTNAKLFRFLKNTTNGNVKAYSKDDRLFISSFIRLAGIPQNLIQNVKVRQLSKK